MTILKVGQCMEKEKRETCHFEDLRARAHALLAPNWYNGEKIKAARWSMIGHAMQPSLQRLVPHSTLNSFWSSSLSKDVRHPWDANIRWHCLRAFPNSSAFQIKRPPPRCKWSATTESADLDLDKQQLLLLYPLLYLPSSSVPTQPFLSFFTHFLNMDCALCNNNR